MKRENGKMMQLAVLAGIALVVLFISIYYFYLRPEPSSDESFTSKINYVLVNEDRGAEFNKVKYNLGSDFVLLVNHDITHLWHTASRSVANAGLNSGAFDAMIVLPHDFSEKLLSLQEPSPIRARVFYEIAPSRNYLTQDTILENVGLILQDFNERVIQMYFSSILGNLFQAQQNVRMITLGELSVQTDLESQIHYPFSQFPESFGLVAADTEALWLMNQSWQEQQDAFSENAQEALRSTAEDFQASMEDMIEYRIIKERIGHLNLVNTQNAVRNQSATDEEHYFDIFSNLDRTALSEMEEFLSTNGHDESTGLMHDLSVEYDNASQAQNDRIGELIVLIALLNIQASELATLRGDIAEAYFGSRTATPHTAGADEVRGAILAFADFSRPESSNLATAYFDVLHADISSLAYLDLQELLPELFERRIISYSQLTEYWQALSLVQRYASETYITASGLSHSFALLDARNELQPDVAVLPHMASVSLATDMTNILAISSPRNITIDPGVDDALRLGIIARLDEVLSGNGTSDVEMSQDNRAISITFEPATSEDSQPSPPGMPQNIHIPLELDIIWRLDDHSYLSSEGQEFNDPLFTITLNEETIASSPPVFSASANFVSLDFLQDDFSLLLAQFELLDRIVWKLVFIFGEATPEGQTLDGFMSLLPSEDYGTIRQNAAVCSVYWRYAQLNQEDIGNMITDSLLTRFREIGTALWHDVSDHYTRIKSTINGDAGFESLTGILNGLPPPDILLKEVQALLDWHESALLALSEARGNWQESPMMLLELTEFSQFDGDAESDTRLFYDVNAGNQLLCNLHDLIESTSAIALATGDAASDIRSLEEEFSELIEQTESIKEEAQVVLDDMSLLLDAFIPQVATNLDYADNFESVLSNARIGGADNPQVMQFLSNPIEPVHIEGEMGNIGASWRNIAILSTFIPLALAVGVMFGRRMPIMPSCGKLNSASAHATGKPSKSKKQKADGQNVEEKADAFR